MRAELNRLTADDVLLLVVTDPVAGDIAPEDGSLALRPVRQSGGVVGVPASRVRVDGSSVRVELGGLDLTEGDWDLLWTEGGARAPVSTTDAGFSLADRAEYLARARDRELRVLRTEQGSLRLRARPVRPHAELARVEITADALSVSGSLAYMSRGQGSREAELIARQRKRSGVVRQSAELVDGVFHCSLPLAPVVRAHDFQRAHNEWDLWLRVDAADAELRLAALGDDLAGKKEGVRFPIRLRESNGHRLRMRPYYTVDDYVSLLVTDAGPSEAEQGSQ